MVVIHVNISFATLYIYHMFSSKNPGLFFFGAAPLLALLADTVLLLKTF